MRMNWKDVKDFVGGIFVMTLVLVALLMIAAAYAPSPPPIVP